MTLCEALNTYQAKQDETGRIHLRCLCDGTLVFMNDMVVLLKNYLDCIDIKTSYEIVTEGIPEGKPWCNCLMKASGMPTTGAKIYYTQETENRYEESELYKWLSGNSRKIINPKSGNEVF